MALVAVRFVILSCSPLTFSSILLPISTHLYPSLSPSHGIGVYDGESYELIRTLQGHKDVINHLKFITMPADDLHVLEERHAEAADAAIRGGKGTIQKEGPLAYLFQEIGLVDLLSEFESKLLITTVCLDLLDLTYDEWQKLHVNDLIILKIKNVVEKLYSIEPRTTVVGVVHRSDLTYDERQKLHEEKKKLHKEQQEL